MLEISTFLIDKNKQLIKGQGSAEQKLEDVHRNTAMMQNSHVGLEEQIKSRDVEIMEIQAENKDIKNRMRDVELELQDAREVIDELER